MNGVREPILYSFTLDKTPGHKFRRTAKIKLFKNVNKPVLSHIELHLEDDDHKAVDSKGEIISFTC